MEYLSMNGGLDSLAGINLIQEGVSELDLWGPKIPGRCCRNDHGDRKPPRLRDPSPRTPAHTREALIFVFCCSASYSFRKIHIEHQCVPDTTTHRRYSTEETRALPSWGLYLKEGDGDSGQSKQTE